MKTEARGLSKHGLLWGLALGAAVVLCIQILTWVGLGLSHLTWILTYVLVVVFALLASRSLRQRLGAAPGLWQAAVLIALMILVSRVIYQTYMYVYIYHVDPTWIDTVDEVWTAQLRESGASEDVIARNIADFRSQWQPGYIFSLGIIRYGIAQFILGFLTAILGAVQPWRKANRSAKTTA